MVLATCSSPRGRGTCPSFSPCGGTLTGRWNAVSFCADGDAAQQSNNAQSVAECRALYLSVVYDHVTSSLDFATGASASVGTVSYLTTTELELTNGCSLALEGSDVSPEICKQFASRLESNGWIAPADCSGSTVCYCRSGVSHGPSQVLFDSSTQRLLGADGEDVPYCVRGDTLTLVDRSQGIDIQIHYQRQPGT